jgi:hypothetical protein
MAKKNKKDDVEAFEDEDVEDVDDEDEDDDDDADDDDDENEDDDTDDDDDEEPFEPGFSPFLITENAEWDLNEIIDSVNPGEDVYFFKPSDPDERTPAKWYKLQSVNIGELPQS